MQVRGERETEKIRKLSIWESDFLMFLFVLDNEDRFTSSFKVEKLGIKRGYI